MENKAWLRLAAVVLVLPFAAACAREDETEANIEVETEPAATPAAPVTVMINPQGGSTIGGELTATHEAENTKVRLNLTGLMEDKTYDAKIRYGSCAVAMNYLDGDDDTPAGANSPAATPETTATDAHDVGEEVADFSLDETGTTATGEVDIDNDELRAGEAAFVMVTEDAGVGDPDVLIGCAELSGHGGMGGTAPAPGTTPGAEPGTAAPAEPGRR
jgi:hypothetical protein